MKILHRYIMRQTLKNLLGCLAVFTALFIIFDFFERIDHLIYDGASFWLTVYYFLLKIPLTVSLMLPVSMLVAVVLTLGMFAKNSELIAMRASGLKIFWIAQPIFIVAFCLSLFSIIIDETLVPYTQRRQREIYNIDIRQKDKRGGYNQENFWWRNKDTFYKVNMFDSRTSTMLGFSELQLDENFDIVQRTDAQYVNWLDELLGWSMSDGKEYKFKANLKKPASVPDVEAKSFSKLPLPIGEKPQAFYDVKTDPFSMGFFQLRRFIKRQTENGIPIGGYMADLYAKLSFPCVTLIVTLVALPFCIRPGRSSSLAVGFLAAVILSFSYHVVHSLSLALGRAELWPAFLAAWMANLLLAFIGLVLSLGAEAP